MSFANVSLRMIFKMMFPPLLNTRNLVAGFIFASFLISAGITTCPFSDNVFIEISILSIPTMYFNIKMYFIYKLFGVVSTFCCVYHILNHLYDNSISLFLLSFTLSMSS